jgi:hypothetical protein
MEADEIDRWLEADLPDALARHRPLPDDVLRAIGKKEHSPPFSYEGKSVIDLRLWIPTATETLKAFGNLSYRLWRPVWEVLNSNFGTALAGAAAGANCRRLGSAGYCEAK